MTSLLLVVVAYLVGAIPFGLLVGMARKVDIRRHGSGNIGATNAGRVLGRPYGILVFVLDFLKGAVPALVGGWWLADHHADLMTAHLWWIAVAGAAILGHMFPVYLGFKGGKGVATSLGVLLGMYPYFTWPGVIVFALWTVLTLVTRYVSVGSMVGAGAFPLIFAGMAYYRSAEWGGFAVLWPLYAFSLVIAALVLYRHRTNLRRLLAGTESKIGGARGETGSAV